MNWNSYGECDGQLNLFELDCTPFSIAKDREIRLIELFAGVGSQAMSLRDLGANFTRWKVVEFDKYAIASYNSIHNTSFPTLDVTKIHGSDLEIVDIEKYTYICFYSFPCTDLSVCGKMLGMDEGSGTRSSLLWEVKRLIDEVENLPQVLVMENVPQIHSEANMPSFQKWLNFLDGKGYRSKWCDLNAKDYGVAQSRNRTFCVSILGNYTYEFPKKVKLEKCMADYLEDEVDDRYYLYTEKARQLIEKLLKEGKILEGGRNTERKTVRLVNCGSSDENRTPSCELSDEAVTILARDYKGIGNYGSNGVVEIEGGYRQCVDLSYQQAKTTDICSCIKARYDAGINRPKNERTGVCECTRLSDG